MQVIALSGRTGPEPAAFVAPEALGAPGAVALDLDNATGAGARGLARLAAHLPHLALIRIPFPDFGDGRGFTLARRLRAMGYGGRLRAAGPLIPDQRGALLACGFDEVALPPALLARQGGPGAWAGRAGTAPPFRQRLVDPTDAAFGFGGAQIIRRLGPGCVAGSDPRKDGAAAGF